MPYQLRTFTCTGCGGPVRKRAPAGSPQRCILCSVEHSAEAIRQLHQHSGPAWEAWAQSMHRALGCPLADLTREDLARAAAAMAAGDRGRGMLPPQTRPDQQSLRQVEVKG